MRTTPALTACGLVLLVVLVSTARPAPLAAASPSASASAPASEGPPERPPFEAWLDRPVPPDAAAGDTLDVGVTIWDALGREIPRLGATIFVQAVPPAGGGDPVRVVAIRDWPGHFRAQVDVPAGGLDRLETGIPGTVCENDVCRPDDWLIPVAGTGPPPDAPITTIAEARIDTGGTALAANRPADVSVAVRPRADWRRSRSRTRSSSGPASRAARISRRRRYRSRLGERHLRGDDHDSPRRRPGARGGDRRRRRRRDPVRDVDDAGLGRGRPPGRGTETPRRHRHRAPRPTRASRRSSSCSWSGRRSSARV
jgi:hypothetical protein